MDAVKSTSGAIRTATDAVNLINNIQNGTTTSTEILDELSQIENFHRLNCSSQRVNSFG